MKNIPKWAPSKFCIKRGRIIVPGNKDALAPGSVLMASLISHWYARNIPLYAKGTILDMGCGKMPYYLLYKDHVDEVLGTDWPQSLHGDTFLDFGSNLNEGLPLKDNSIDTMLASDVFEHILHPEKLLAEMNRVLKPGGVVLLNTPFLYWVHEAPFDYFRYTPFAWDSMAKSAGFKVERIDALGGAVLVLADILGKIVQSVPKVGRFLAASMQKLTLKRYGECPRSEVYPLTIGAVFRKSDR